MIMIVYEIIEENGPIIHNLFNLAAFSLTLACI